MVAALLFKAVALVAFFLTGGAVFANRFRKFRALGIAAAVVSIVGALYLLRDIWTDVVGLTSPPTTQSLADNIPAEPPVPINIEELCAPSVREWERATNLAAQPMRQFLETVPANCVALRSTVTLRLQELQLAERAQFEDEAYNTALGARTRASYNAFLRDYPQSQRANDVRARISSCRQSLVQTGAYSDQDIQTSAPIFDNSTCINIADCPDYNAAGRRAFSQCGEDLGAQCAQSGGSLFGLRQGSGGMGVAVTCTATCRIATTSYQEQCN